MSKDGIKVTDILGTLLSALIKIAVAVWVVNFIYTKALSAYDFGYRVFTESAVSPAPGRDVSVYISEDKTLKDIAKLLEEKGLVRDYKLAYVQLLVAEKRDGMEPGTYTLNTSMTTEEMVDAMNPPEEESEE